MALRDRLGLGRRNEGTAAAAPQAAADGAGVVGTAAGRAGDPAGGAPVRRADWQALPPISRATGGAPGAADLADPGRFISSLTTRQNPSFTGPLGHAVSSAAPAGVLHGVLRPVAGVPVQRAAAGAAELSYVRPLDEAPAGEPAVGGAPGGETPARGASAGGALPRLAVPRPAVPARAGAVQRAAVGGLTKAAPVVGPAPPLPALPLSTPRTASASAQTATAASGSVLPGSVLPDSVPPTSAPAQVRATVGERAAAVESPATAATTATTAAVQRAALPDAGELRLAKAAPEATAAGRTGLAAPLDGGLPATAAPVQRTADAVQRTAAPGPTGAGAAGPVVQRADRAPGATRAAESAEPARAAQAGPPAKPGPVVDGSAVVQRQRRSGLGEPLAELPASAVAPLLGDRAGAAPQPGGPTVSGAPASGAARAAAPAGA
ncbi:hypothetical protein ACFW1A_32615, partial [Kitasatospora sp. NPDC058965]